MYPNLFGIDDFSYTLCMFLGIAICFALAIFYLKRKGLTKAGAIDLLICACVAVLFGIVFSIIFENFYELIEKGSEFVFSFKMTFFGGLAGGVFGFLLAFYLMRKNCNFKIGEVTRIAPLSITIAHAFGRIGCFLAGCCYGKHTDSWIGITFPGIGKVIPTQLIESCFLFLLFAVLALLLFVFKFKYTFVVYMISYGIFRFIIEYYRDDPRGVIGPLSPSQIWSIIFVVLAIPLGIFLKKVVYEKE